MNLLVLSSWFPYPPGNGSRIRAYNLLRELARAGHTIRLVAGLQTDVADEKEAGIAALRDMGIAEVVTVPWQWYNGGTTGGRGKLRAALSPVPRSILETPNHALSQAIAEQIARPTDAVLVMEMGMDAYLPAQLPPNMPFILEGVESKHLTKPDSGGAKMRARMAKALRYWQTRLNRYRAVTTVSRSEADATRVLMTVGGSCPQIAVVPNGVTSNIYGPREWNLVESGRLIYNGSPTYGPNLDAVWWFANSVSPLLPEPHPLRVTGRFTSEEAAFFAPFADTIHLTGFVPDLRPLLAQSAVCVVPLLSGGGTRLKILEAWAAGVPVVSTTVGAAGLEGAIPETHFLQADTAVDFAYATLRLLTDPDLCRTLSENARALVAKRYDWEIVGKTLNALLLETCRPNKPS